SDAGSLGSLGHPSVGGDRARAVRRALSLLGRREGFSLAPGFVLGVRAGALLLVERTAARPVGYVPVQRPHAAASDPHAGIPPAAPVRHARVGGPAVAQAAVGDGTCPGDHEALAGRDHFLRRNRLLALPPVLRAGDAASQPAHRPASHFHRDQRRDVVAGTVPRAGIAAGVLPHPDGLPVPSGTADVPGRRDDHARGYADLPVLRGGAAPGLGALTRRGSAIRRPADVGAGDALVLGRDDGDLVPVGGPG